jgi:predicted nucleic acid-binding Zn ribbon protein
MHRKTPSKSDIWTSELATELKIFDLTNENRPFDWRVLQTVVLAAIFAPEILCAIWIKTTKPHFAVRFNDECSNKNQKKVRHFHFVFFVPFATLGIVCVVVAVAFVAFASARTPVLFSFASAPAKSVRENLPTTHCGKTKRRWPLSDGHRPSFMAIFWPPHSSCGGKQPRRKHLMIQ